MATFLELFQDFVSQAGITSSTPTAVTGQSGLLLKSVNWLNKAYVDIQRKHPDWLFMYEDFDFETIAGISDYTASSVADNVGTWDVNSFRIYKVSDGVSKERRFGYKEYFDWRRTYELGSHDNSVPSVFTVKPSNDLAIGPPPNDEYKVSGNFYLRATSMVANGDVPILPTDFHDIIIHLALIYYAKRYSKGDVYSTATIDFQRMYGELARSQRPAKIMQMRPLA